MPSEDPTADAYDRQTDGVPSLPTTAITCYRSLLGLNFKSLTLCFFFIRKPLSSSCFRDKFQILACIRDD